MEGNVIVYFLIDMDIGFFLVCFGEIFEDFLGNMINIELLVGKDKVILVWLFNFFYCVGWVMVFVIVFYNLGVCFVMWKEVLNVCKLFI